MRERLNAEYFEWMYQLVCADRYNERLSYRKLLSLLHDIEFVYTMPSDDNRAIDGIDFRYKFGYEYGYSRGLIAQHIDTRPCSVLEMMVALAYRVENQFMTDSDYGDRTGQWFWSMMVNLGLGRINDDNFDPYIVEKTIERFINRDYEPNGAGGLVILEHCNRDLRDVNIWTQMMWYLNEVSEG